ncbi:sensor histidine kinase [Mangrovihabitans endophyticus]|uniref:Histidine kinase domain-containing protein n=1 Tax=Mangrovihabitans endophyticus TaxID=1751298 RepID=A0A8J3C2Y3_9ACTN|nr:sensor histidine kinase [Mangrovihabitans endophyticus]GGL09839.1 hypothetical protein GCM10012284_50710 [Mangrovihabitans endophyticus]
MTDRGAMRGLDQWRQRLDRWVLLVPYACLAGSVALSLVADAFRLLPAKPFLWGLALSVVAAAWLAWFVTLHPQWEHRRGLMAVFFLGHLLLIFLLIWVNPLYGFYGWTGYLVLVYALPGRWRLVGAGAVACSGAISQIGGFDTLTALNGRIAFAMVLALNLVIAVGMTHLTTATHEQSNRRAAMIDELAEANERLEAALQENAGLHAQLLNQAREAGVLDERQRMAGEIHDVLAQGLTGIVTQLEAADAARSRPNDLCRHLDTAKRLARDSLAEARRSVQALRPQNLDAAALPDAIDEVVRGWSRLNDVTAELITTGTPRPLLPEIETTLLRTAQEALANVARHAGATRVALTLSYMEDLVSLDVRDDGTGFDPEAPLAADYPGGYGLNAMRERVIRIAGRLDVESEPGAGTAISARVPAIAQGAAA